MRPLLSALLGLVLAAGLRAETVPAEAPGLTLVSFNIRNGGRRMDGVYDRPMQQRVIASLKPDLVALQEVDRKTRRVDGADVPAEFARALGCDNGFAYAPAMPYAGGEYGTAALARLPTLRVRAIPLPVPGGEPRAAALLVCRAAGIGAVGLVSVHLDASDKDTARLANARALLAALAQEHIPLVVAGDFNDGPDSATLALFLRAGFRRCVPQGDARTHPADNPGIIIDHVLVRDGGGLHVADAGTRVAREPAASDHRPMVARLRFTPLAHP